MLQLKRGSPSPLLLISQAEASADTSLPLLGQAEKAHCKRLALLVTPLSLPPCLNLSLAAGGYFIPAASSGGESPVLPEVVWIARGTAPGHGAAVGCSPPMVGLRIEESQAEGRGWVPSTQPDGSVPPHCSQTLQEEAVVSWGGGARGGEEPGTLCRREGLISPRGGTSHARGRQRRCSNALSRPQKNLAVSFVPSRCLRLARAPLSLGFPFAQPLSTSSHHCTHLPLASAALMLFVAWCLCLGPGTSGI